MAYSARSFGRVERAAKITDPLTFKTSSQPWAKHFSSPRVILKTISISQSLHRDPARMCRHEDSTARETNEERYGRVRGGICAPHFIHVVACSLSNAVEKAAFTLQHIRQSLNSSSDNSLPGIF